MKTYFYYTAKIMLGVLKIILISSDHIKTDYPSLTYSHVKKYSSHLKHILDQYCFCFMMSLLERPEALCFALSIYPYFHLSIHYKIYECDNFGTKKSQLHQSFREGMTHRYFFFYPSKGLVAA